MLHDHKALHVIIVRNHKGPEVPKAPMATLTRLLSLFRSHTVIDFFITVLNAAHKPAMLLGKYLFLAAEISRQCWSK